MKEEIKQGILIAMERGSNLEDAAKTFINAGYNPSEVSSAVKEISLSNEPILSKKESLPEQKEVTETPQYTAPVPQSNESFPKPLPTTDSVVNSPQEKKSSMLVLILLIILGVLAIAIGILIYLNPSIINKILS